MFAQCLDLFHKPPETGHAHIGRDRARHPVEGKRALRLGRDRHVRGARGDDPDTSAQGLRGGSTQNAGLAQSVIVEIGMRQRPGPLGREPRQQEAASRLFGGAQDCRDLIVRLAVAEDRLGGAGAQGAVPVHAMIGHSAALRKAAPRR